MPDETPAKTSNALIHIDGDSQAVGEAAKLFLQIVNDAVGGWLKPWQIRRVADAEADAKLTHAMAEIRATSLQKRAAQRWLAEEEAKQANMEAITAKALPHLSADAQPGKIERDWLTNFFDKSRLTSDAEMQELWAKILAGEANVPGKFSKRAVATMAAMDRDEALRFQELCRFCWFPESRPVPNRPFLIIFPIYLETQPLTEHFMVDSWLPQLEEIGLVKLKEPESELTQSMLSGHSDQNKFVVRGGSRWRYYGDTFEFGAGNYTVPVGRVQFIRPAEELSAICLSKPVEGLADRLVKYWNSIGVEIRRVKQG